MKLKVRLVLLSLVLATAANAQQQKAAPQPDLKAGTSPEATGSKSIPADGPWSGKDSFDKIFAFVITNHVLTGSGRIPIHFMCNVPQEVKSIPGQISVENAVGTSRFDSTAVKDFSKIMHSSAPHGFGATFQVSEPDFGPEKYTVVVKGTFLSETSASGSVSVTSSACKGPTVYKWEAIRQGPAEQ